MKFRTKRPYTPQDRKSLAEFLAGTISGYPQGFEPYMPNKNDDYYWTVDSGNDWKLHFSRENPCIFEIRYRYQSQSTQFEEALAGWLMIRLLNLEILPS